MLEMKIDIWVNKNIDSLNPKLANRSKSASSKEAVKNEFNK